MDKAVAVEEKETKVAESSNHDPLPKVTKVEDTKAKTEVKKDEVTTDEQDLLEEIEKGEDGKFFLKAGDSTYFGTTKKEVLQNLYKGKLEQDQVIRKAKAAEAVKLPKEETADEAPILELPDDAEVYSKYLSTEVKKAGVDPKMLSWKDEDWDRYQDENSLKDRHIIRLQDQVKAVIDKANQLTDRDMSIASVAVNNNHILEQATKQVREMIADSGIDAEKFDYKAALDSAMAKRDKAGRIPAGAIEAEAAKQITKIMRSSSPVKKDLADEAARAKGRIKTPGGGGKVTDENDSKTLSWDELTRQTKSRIAAHAGRDI